METLEPKTLHEKLEALALQGGSVLLAFFPSINDGRGGWTCATTCEDGMRFDGSSADGPTEAVEDCYNKTFA